MALKHLAHARNLDHVDADCVFHAADCTGSLGYTTAAQEPSREHT
jgi:hypothetical protein